MELGLSWGSVQVVVDTVTGVNYLFTMGINGTSGLTPLLDAEGKPVVDPPRAAIAE